MKKLLLFSLLFIGSIVASFGQYVPLLQSGNQWNVLRNYVNPTHFTEISKIDSDTIIDGRTCKKIVSTNDSTDNAIYHFKCYLYEDATAKKVYVYDAQYNQKLYFDFTVQLGDTIALYSQNYNSLDTFVVSQISNVYINNTIRKIITLDYYSSNFHMQNVDSWIEGVGSLKGLIYGNISPQFVGSQFSLLCMSNSNEMLYQNPNFNNCYMTNVKIDEIMNDFSVHIYPNPVTDFLTISELPKSISNIKIIDVFGRTVFQSEMNGNCKNIDLSNYQSGVYFVVVFNQKKVLFAKKIIKK